MSSQKRDQDARTRQRRIEKTIHELDVLKQKIGTRQWKTKEQVVHAVSAILDKHHCSEWFEWKVVAEQTTIYKQKGMGRPGKNTEYVKMIKEKWTFEAMPNGPRIQRKAETDGMFPLMTNMAREELSMRQILLKYKFQPYIEKRHQQLKSVFNAAPVFLKTPHRIEALMFVYFIVLLVQALIERQLRLAMKRQQIQTLPLYPESRKCRYPSTARIIELFSHHRKHVLTGDGKQIKCFHDELSSIQKTVLQLLDISDSHYEGM